MNSILTAYFFRSLFVVVPAAVLGGLGWWVGDAWIGAGGAVGGAVLGALGLRWVLKDTMVQ